jgi:hypothetical protein
MRKFGIEWRFPMSYTLQQLAGDIRTTLERDPTSEGRRAVCGLVERALTDEGFLGENFGPERTKPREILFEDPKLGFCICAHVYQGAASSSAHDHGPSWAIYGQAAGVTQMTDWKIVKPAKGEDPALVEPVRTYELKPGMAHFYDVGAVHSPKREAATKLLRIEGKNLDTIKRSNIKPAA